MTTEDWNAPRVSTPGETPIPDWRNAEWYTGEADEMLRKIERGEA